MGACRLNVLYHFVSLARPGGLPNHHRKDLALTVHVASDMYSLCLSQTTRTTCGPVRVLFIFWPKQTVHLEGRRWVMQMDQITMRQITMRQTQDCYRCPS